MNFGFNGALPSWPASDAIDQMSTRDPVMASGSLSFQYVGEESVTVPEGSYDCKKYVASLGGSEYTYWAAANIPVPVKISGKNKIMELAGWG